MQPGLSATEKAIRSTTLLFGALSLLRLWSGLGLLRVLVAAPAGLGRADGSVLVPLLLAGLLPIATLLYWRRRALGWLLVVAYLLYALAGGLLGGWLLLTWQPTGTGLDLLFPAPSLAATLWQLAWPAGVLYVVSRPAVRAAFAVKAGQVRLAAALGLAAGLGWWLAWA